MSTRSSILAMAAVAALGTTTLTTSSAFAFGHGPMGVKVRPQGPMGVKIPPHGPIGIVPRPIGVVPHPIGVVPHPIGVIPHPIGVVPHPIGIPPHPIGPCDRDHDRCGGPPVVIDGGGVVGIVPVGVGVAATVPVGGAAVLSPTAAAPACNCLTKTYLQGGAVVFKDLCTNEMAMNPPATAVPQGASTSMVPVPQAN
jgi:hypothetical protein